jgi:hypothetical protein
MEIRRQRWKASDVFFYAASFRENSSTGTGRKREEKSGQGINASGAIARAMGYLMEI